ncbi:MAG: glutamine--fructose-6-phosphate transaminase (isomerizing) [Candidatus Saccharibacteria bacterium]|nr:glutamine--fructose-6-phosphate transaminase (isomerizing) [Candidatus Saccharibacteria bacterium]
MCGIVATVGHKNAPEFILEGLESLEYRGYDSAGLAILNSDSEIEVVKVVGHVANLKDKTNNQNLTGRIGLGHTRWATHGQVLTKNAHPHQDQNGDFFIVHNGIIENFQSLKDFLMNKGHRFSSDTDSEVIAHLLAYNYKKLKSVKSALIASLQSLRGAYALAVISKREPNKLWGAKLSGPLILGLAKDNSYYLASDSLALASVAQKIIPLEDFELVEITPKGQTIINLKTDQIVSRPTELMKLTKEDSQLGDFEDYMIKEIHHIPQAIGDAIRGRLNIDQNFITLGGLNSVVDQLQYIDRIIIVACGTSYFAGMVGEYLIEDIANMPVEVHLASEFRYRKQPLSRSSMVIFISQSGETADSIGALEVIAGSGMLKLGIVNVVGSTISRLTDAGIYCRAGLEKSVASTKAFMSQVTILTLIALYLSDNYKDYRLLSQQLVNLPSQLSQFLNQHQIKKIANKYYQASNFMFLGRNYNYPVALEGALKLKEISYIHAEALASGELKHGSLALIDKKMPSLVIALSGKTLDKNVSSIAEIKARKGKVIAIVDDAKSPIIDQVDDVIVIPKVIEPLQPLVSAIACHLFAYYMAKALDRPIDRPRNLAKSVTVE